MTQRVDVYKLIVDVEGAQTIGQLEQGLKSLKAELKDTDIGTVAFTDLQKAIADTEQKLGVMGQKVQQSGDRINNTYKKAAIGIVSGFQAAAGAMAVFTGGSEKSVQALIKLQALMALKDSISGLIEAKKGFSELSTLIGQKLTRAFSTAAGAARAFGAALGIGLIIAGISLLISKWDDILEAVTKVGKEQRNNVKTGAEALKVAEKTLDNLNAQDETLKRQGLSEQAILDIKIRQLEVVQKLRKQQLENLEDLLKEQKRANAELSKGTRGYGVINQLVFGTSDQGIKDQEKAIEDLKFSLLEGQNAIDGFRNRQDALDKKANDDAIERARKLKEEREKQAAELRKAQYESYLQDVKREEDLAAQKLSIEKRLQEEIKIERMAESEWLKAEASQRQLDLLQSYIDGQLSKEQLDEQLRQAELEQLEKQRADRLFHGESTLEIDILIAQKRIDINNQANQQMIDDDRAMAEARIGIAQNFVDIIQNIGNALTGEQEKQNILAKVAALARIGIDTALAISSLVKNSEQNPANAVTFGLAGVAQFAAGIARITANIAQARKLLGGGGGGGTYSAPSGGGFQAPTVAQRPVMTQNLNKITDDIKVKVVVKDINDGQKTVRVIDSNSFVV